jgi:hypothetical protein
MAKIAVVCDDYKVDMFTKEFNALDLLFTVERFTEHSYLFTVIGEQDIVAPIVEKVTKHFIDKYKNQN